MLFLPFSTADKNADVTPNSSAISFNFYSFVNLSFRTVIFYKSCVYMIKYIH